MKLKYTPKELTRRAKKRKKAIEIAKLTALNKIKKIHHPKYDGYIYASGFEDDYYSDSKGDQRDRMIANILSELEAELEPIRQEEKLDKNHSEQDY
jgi:hypothetical protein